METTQGPKTPLQIRLDHAELAALDVYIAQFTDFPPSRVDVVRKAIHEWLAQKMEPAPNVQALQPATAAPVMLHALTAPRTKPLTPQQHAVMQYMREHGNGPVTAEALQTGLRWKQESLAAVLRHMMQAGILVSTSAGRYAVPATSHALDLA
jgi:hypothetical protein